MSTQLSELSDFGRKWSDLTAKAIGAGISSDQIKSVYDLDLQRLQTSGDYAMSDSEAWQALLSVKGGAPTTQAPAQPFSVGSIPGYAVSDVKDLGVGLLGLFKKGVEDVIHPSDIAGQVSALWRNPAVLEDPLKTLADPSDWLHPSNIAKEMAASPLFSALVPGVWDAGLIQQYGVKGGVEAMLEHPASSLLDVLPIATKGAELAATVAKTGLSEDAVSAAKDAASFSPFDTSSQALRARESFADAIPSTIRRAALYGENGLGSAVIRTLMGVPFDDGTMGDYLSTKLSMKTGGSLGWESIAIGRLFTAARREYGGAVKELADNLGQFYKDHGIDDPSEKEDFTKLVTHYTPDWATKLGFSPDEIQKFTPALEQYQDLVSEEANKDIAADRLSVVTDPRTGATEIRALDGNDGRVVRAATRAATLADRARTITDRMGALMDYPFRGDPEEAIKQWMGSRILSGGTRVFEQIGPKEENLANQLFDKPFTKDGWAKVSKLFGKNGKFAKLRAHVDAGNLKAMRTDVRSILGTLKGAYAKSNPMLARLEGEFRTAQDMLREYANGSKTISDAKLATARAMTLMDRYPEARFAPRMTELVADGLMKHLNGAEVSDEDFSVLEDMLQNGVWKGAKFGDLVGAKAFAQIRNSAVQTLIEERAAGLEPVWVPSVSSTEIPRIGQAGIDLERISKSRSLKSRASINPAAVYEPIIGLIRKGAEDLEEKAMQELFYGDGGIKPRWGLSFDDAARQGLQYAKGISLEGTRATSSHIVERWVNENFTEISPKDWIARTPAHAVGLGKAAEDSFLVPKSIAKALEANVKATRGPQNFASRAYLRGTQIFRYSLLNFSPRYQAHIYFGGMALGVLREGPQILRYLPAAMGMSIQDSAGLLEAVEHGHLGAIKPVIDWLKSKAESQGEHGLNPHITHELAESNPDLIKEYNYRAGGKLGKMLDQAMANRGLSAGLEMANFGANMWRAAAYLSGKARGGVEEGITTALKVYADMDALTPLERTITRYAIPFYGWTRHILRYALELPMDHPLRAAILSRMVNQEWQDWPTGIPQDMMYLFQIGGIDPAGNVQAVDIRQLDPLRSVTDVFTMAGFLSSLNPLFQSVAAPALGINPETASPEDLYPTLTIDSFYGTKSPTRPNPLSVLAQGVGGYIPEASVLDHFIGISSYTRWAKANDPQAYKNQLYQALNVPWLPQTINMYQTVAKSELNNFSVASAAATAALADPNPNDSTWTSLIKEFNYVPYSGWLVQPFELRRWAFAQVESQGYWNNQTQTSSLPPDNIIIPPKAPKL